MAKVIYADFRKNKNPIDPCSKCDRKDTCTITCQEAFIYWENLANKLKGK